MCLACMPKPQRCRQKQHYWCMGVLCAGGMGKSTLANAVFNRLSHDFVGGRAITVPLPYTADASEGLSNAQFEAYLKQLNVPTGTSSQEALRNRLAEGRILLLLDNITTQRQLDAILPRLRTDSSCKMGPGSFVILTTRHQNLALYMATLLPGTCVYSMPGMSDAAAKQLFRSKADISDKPAEFLAAVKVSAMLPLSRGHVSIGMHILALAR